MTTPTPAAPRKKHTVRTVLLATAGLLVLVVVANFAWARWASRPQGDPEAVEFGPGVLSTELTSAPVLGFSEATHGNHEFQDLRTRLVTMTAELGYTGVVFEEDFGNAQVVDRFVQGGPGTAEDAAREFGFAINKTAEAAETLQTLRDINADRPVDRRIHVYGNDVQRIDASKRLALDALRDTDPQAADDLAADLAGMEDDAKFTEGYSEAGKLEPTQDLADRVAPLADSETRADRMAARAAAVLVQGRELHAADDSAYGADRDRMMFENLKWILAEEQRRDGKLLLFGHNGHLDKSHAAFRHETLGSLAAAEWRSGYRVIGSDYFRTRFLSGTRDVERSEFDLTNRSPLRGVFAGRQIGYLDFVVAGEKNRELLSETVLMGSAGEFHQKLWEFVPGYNAVPTVPADAYDALVFVNDATPVTMLPPE